MARASIVPDPRPRRRRARGGIAGRPLTAAALLWLAAAPPVVLAERYQVQVVVGAAGAPQQALLAAMHEAVAAADARHLGVRIHTPEEYARPRSAARPPQLVVSIGLAAGEAVLRASPPVPVLCAFLPRSSYEQLRRRLPPGVGPASGTALFVDQPPERQLRLLRLALPRARRVGVVLGPDSRGEEPRLREAAAAAGLGLDAERIADERELVGAAHRLLGRTDALLAVPDRLVSNRHTLPGVLLTAYRHGKPVVGYSAAYVSAGALLAVVSTPEQLGRQLGEMLVALAAAPPLLPPPQYPRYFSVQVNERVARSLGVLLPPASELARRLAEAEDSGR